MKTTTEQHSNVLPKNAPNTYPEGEPCGFVAHFVWCRCEKPNANDPERYGPGHCEYERCAKLNREYQAIAHGAS